MSSVEFRNKMNHINRKLDDVLLNVENYNSYSWIMQAGMIQRAKNDLKAIDESLASIQSESGTYSAAELTQVNAFSQQLNKVRQQVKALEVPKATLDPAAPASDAASASGIHIGKIGGLGPGANVRINGVQYTGPSAVHPTVTQHPFGIPSTKPATPRAESLELQTAGPENEASLLPFKQPLPSHTPKPQYETPSLSTNAKPMPLPSSPAPKQPLPASPASRLLQNVHLSPGHIDIGKISNVHQQNIIIHNEAHFNNTYTTSPSPTASSSLAQTQSRARASTSATEETDISHGHRQTKRTSPNGQVSYYVEKVTNPPKNSTAEGSERSPLLSSSQVSHVNTSSHGSALLSSSTGSLPAAQAVSTPASALQALNASRQDQTRWNALKTAIVDKISDAPAGPARAALAEQYRECIDLRINASRQCLSAFFDTSTRTRVNDQLQQQPNATTAPRGLKR